jgi:transposase
LRSQLQQHRHLTLQLAWEEYRQVHPEGYGYSRFCGLYQRWRRKQDVVLCQVHQPGEKGFVDWADATIPVHDPATGEIWPASLFVIVLGTSSYTYAETTSPPARFCEPHRFVVERDRESGITCRFAAE